MMGKSTSSALNARGGKWVGGMTTLETRPRANASLEDGNLTSQT